MTASGRMFQLDFKLPGVRYRGNYDLIYPSQVNGY